SPSNDETLARFLTELAGVLRQRRRDLPQGSFSAQLFREGRSAIAEKLVEEAVESALAAESEGRERAISELTDLLYVMLVLATDLDATPEEVRLDLVQKRTIAPSRRSK